MEPLDVGTDLWRVRVDLFAVDDDGHRSAVAAEALRSMLDDHAALGTLGDIGADHGLGVTSRPVVGLIFWVAADDVGAAALKAVDAARRAGANHGVGPELYDVTIIPRQAVVDPDDPLYPLMPD